MWLILGRIMRWVGFVVFIIAMVASPFHTGDSIDALRLIIAFLAVCLFGYMLEQSELARRH